MKDMKEGRGIFDTINRIGRNKSFAFHSVKIHFNHPSWRKASSNSGLSTE